MDPLPPIQKTVDPKLSITNAEQALALEKAFDDVFGPLSDKPQDGAKPEIKPATPASAEPELEEPAQETVLPAEEGETQTSEEPERTVVGTEADRETAAGHPDDEPDEEIDKFKLYPEAKPESLSVFREIRGMLKVEKKRARELEERLRKQDLSPRSVNDPAVQKEIEELRTFRQRHQIFDDTTYQVSYETPVHNQFGDIINDIKSISNDAAAAADWEKQMRMAGPDRIDKSYWNDGVISQIADPLDRDRVIRKVSTLMELREKRDAFRKQIAEEPDGYAKFQQRQAAEYWDNFGREAQDEMTKVTPQLGEWASPKDLRNAKNATEKAAMEIHNKVYGEYEELFKRFITDAATQGPRGMARISAMAVQNEKRRRDLESAHKKIAKLQAERDKAQEELNKIAGARARVAQPSTAATNGQSPAPKRKASDGVDKAFRDFFGS